MSKPTICHIEWVTADPETLGKFLSELLDWQFQNTAPNYMIYQPAGQGIRVGILNSEKASAGGTPNVSVQVENIDSYLQKAETLGGRVVVPKTELDGGWFAFIAAPDGNLIGFQQ